MRKVVLLILCMVLLCGCSSKDAQQEGGTPESDQPAVSYTVDDVTKELVGKWVPHGMNWTIEITEDGTYIWDTGSGVTTMELTYRSYLNSFAEYGAIIQHDPEFSAAHGVHVISVKERGDMLVGQDENGNYKFYFWGQKWSRAE